MKYNITNNNLSKLFLSIEKELEKNSETIDKLLKIDQKYCKMRINLGQLKNVIDLLKKEKLNIQEEEKIIIKYDGNPYITLNLCILAIINKKIIILDYENTIIGTNSLIVQIVNNVLNEYKTDKLIYLMNEGNYEDDNVDQIICIDDINKYNSYLREKNTKVKFYSHNYIDFYSDSDEYEEIEELIYQYAKEKNSPIETYSELDIEEAVQMIKNGLGKIVVVLTNSDETKQIFEENIKNKALYINKNPFKQDIRLLDREILYM